MVYSGAEWFQLHTPHHHTPGSAAGTKRSVAASGSNASTTRSESAGHSGDTWEWQTTIRIPPCASSTTGWSAWWCSALRWHASTCRVKSQLSLFGSRLQPVWLLFSGWSSAKPHAWMTLYTLGDRAPAPGNRLPRPTPPPGPPSRVGI